VLKTAILQLQEVTDDKDISKGEIELKPYSLCL